MLKPEEPYILTYGKKDDELDIGEIYKGTDKNTKYKLLINVKKDDNYETIVEFKVNDNNPDFLLVSLNIAHCLLLSEDSGDKWRTIYKYDTDKLSNNGVIEFDNRNPGVIYTEEGWGPTSSQLDQSRIFISRDKGNKWEKIFNRNQGEGRVQAMSSIPGDRGIVISISSPVTRVCQILKYNNSSNKWDIMREQSDGKYYILRIIDKNTMYGYGWKRRVHAMKFENEQGYIVDPKILKSTNGGISWEDLNIKLQKRESVLEIKAGLVNPKYLCVIIEDHSDYDNIISRLMLFTDK